MKEGDFVAKTKDGKKIVTVSGHKKKVGSKTVTVKPHKRSTPN